MPRVYRTSVEATNHKTTQERPAVWPRTSSSSPLEPHPHAGESSHTEAADTPHADDASDPLSGHTLL